MTPFMLSAWCNAILPMSANYWIQNISLVAAGGYYTCRCPVLENSDPGKATGFKHTWLPLQAAYEFCRDLGELVRVKTPSRRIPKIRCRSAGPDKPITQSPFAPIRALGNTLFSGKEEVAKRFRFMRSNGITRVFHRKIKRTQRWV